jgi:hypothetical protein
MAAHTRGVFNRGQQLAGHFEDMHFATDAAARAGSWECGLQDGVSPPVAELGTGVYMDADGSTGLFLASLR